MRPYVVAFIAALSMLSAGDLHAQTSSNTVLDRLKELPWQPQNGLTLAGSQTTISAMPGAVAVTGTSAETASKIENGFVAPGIEAEVYLANNEEAVFSYFASGYVSSKDWSSVDPASFLEQIKKNTVDGNAARETAGLSNLFVDGWAQVPFFNRDTNTVSWVINLHTDQGQNLINAVALKLGRYGYQRITLVTDSKQSQNPVGDLLAISNQSLFNSGARYEDFVSGQDHAAAYGIAGLVAGSLGVSILKGLGIGAVILLALKKGAFLILFPFIWLWRKLFKGRQQKPKTMLSLGVRLSERKDEKF